MLSLVLNMLPRDRLRYLLVCPKPKASVFTPSAISSPIDYLVVHPAHEESSTVWDCLYSSATSCLLAFLLLYLVDLSLQWLYSIYKSEETVEAAMPSSTASSLSSTTTVVPDVLPRIAMNTPKSVALPGDGREAAGASCSVESVYMPDETPLERTVCGSEQIDGMLHLDSETLVRFVSLEPAGITGSFFGFDYTAPLEPDHHGQFVIALALPPGHHAYNFIIQ